VNVDRCVWRFSRIMTGMGKPKYAKGNSSQCHIIYQNSHMGTPWLNATVHDVNPGTNRVSTNLSPTILDICVRVARFSARELYHRLRWNMHEWHLLNGVTKKWVGQSKQNKKTFTGGQWNIKLSPSYTHWANAAFAFGKWNNIFQTDNTMYSVVWYLWWMK